MFFLFYFVKVDTLKKKKLDDDVTFFNIILMVISTFNVLVEYIVYHIVYYVSKMTIETKLITIFYFQ